MKQILLVAVFGAAGALGRYGVSSLAEHWFGKSSESFAYGTLAVNLIGCFLLGGVIELLLLRKDLTGDLPADLRAAVGVGLLGAFTTFSTFGLETFGYLQRQQWLLAGANVAANLVLGLLCVWAGVSLARMIAG